MDEGYSPNDRKKGIVAKCIVCDKEYNLRFPDGTQPRQFYENLSEDEVLRLNDFGVTEYLSFVKDFSEKMALRFRIYYQKHNPKASRFKIRNSVLIDFDKGKIKENPYLTPQEKAERKRIIERIRYRLQHNLPLRDGKE